MRELHRSSGNTELTDSCSESLTTLRVLRLFFSTPSTAYIRARKRLLPSHTHVVRSSHMDRWFSVIASGCELAANTVEELDDVGFVVIAGPVAPPHISQLAAVYDAAVSSRDRYRRVVPQAPSSSTTAPSGTDMALTRRTSRGGLFKVPTSAVTTKGRAKRLGCVPKRWRVLEPLPSTS
jgi:hypothetical protein